MQTVSSFWIGPVSLMERISIKSYLAQGHAYELYSYQPIDFPGVNVKDAREIIPLELYDPSDFPKPSNFSDFFRIKLLLDRGGWWVDTDSVCVRSLTPDTFVFSSENTPNGGTIPCSGTLYASEPGTVLLKWMWETCRKMNVSTLTHTSSGMDVLRAGLQRFALDKYIVPPEVFCPIPWWDAGLFVKPDAKLDIPPETQAVHLWNTMWNKKRFDKNHPTPGSFYARLAHDYAT